MIRLIDDNAWQTIESLLPSPKPRRSRYPGRLPVDNRNALNGILFVLKTGIPWEELPQDLGFGSGITCWRRLREWRQNGVWSRMLPHLLSELNEPQSFNWGRVMVTRNTRRNGSDQMRQTRQQDWKTSTPLRLTKKQGNSSPLADAVSRQSA